MNIVLVHIFLLGLIGGKVNILVLDLVGITSDYEEEGKVFALVLMLGLLILLSLATEGAL